jgi:predicted phosphate transport protein (TIGR00153 family)
MGLKELLLPQERKFFDLLEKQAGFMVLGAEVLVEGLERWDKPEELRKRLKDIEHDGDKVVHDIYEALNQTFITPLDREDIHLLISRLDDVMDLMDGTARRIQMFQPGEAPAGAVLLADVIHRTAQALLGAVKNLEANKNGTVSEASKQVKLLEEEGDSLYHEWVSKLFENATDPLTVIKWKEIYDTLERTLDQAEDAANVLESISIKHA